MRDIILALLIGVSIPAMFVRPFIGLLVWCWIGFMLPHRMTYGFAYNLPWAMIVAVAFLTSFLLSKESKRIPFDATVAVLVAMLAWFLIGQLFAPPLTPGGAGAYELSRLWKVQLMTFVVMIMITSKERMVQMLWVVVMSIAFFGIKGGIFTVAHGGNFLVWGPAGGFYEGNNELALTLLMILPLMRFLQLQLKPGWQRHAMTFGMLMCLASVFGSFSRGAVLAMAAMGLFYWFKSSNKIAIGAVLVVAGVIGFIKMPDHWHDRMATILDNPEVNDASARGRINAWKFAYLVAQKEPFGAGFDAFTLANFHKYDNHDRSFFDPEDFHDAHSIYFQMLGEHGYVGLLLFLGLGVTTYFACSRAVRRSRGREDLRWVSELAPMLQVSLVAYAAGGLFLGMGYFDLYYHLVATVVALNAIVEATLKTPVGDATGWGEAEKAVVKPRFAPMPGINAPIRR